MTSCTNLSTCFAKFLTFSFLLLLSFATQGQANQNSLGDKVVTIAANKTIREVLKSITDQTGLRFSYNNSDFNQNERITTSFVDMSIERILKHLFAGRAMSWVYLDNVIRIGKAPKDQGPSIIVEDASGKKNVDTIPLINIAGQVLDPRGQPIAGASVFIRGQSRGQGTDNLGGFKFANIPANGTILISYIGYETRQVKISGKSEFRVTLDSLIREIQAVEVLSTGYQKIAKERATGSFEYVNNDLLNRRVSTNIMDRLQGIVNGLAFNKKDQFGREEISIRGKSTILSNATPLIVVDNYPYEGLLESINPNDIEDITVLKDAAAASIWGARSGNGVIVITTKNGRFNQPTTVELNSNFTISEKPDLFYVPTMTTSDVIDVENLLFDQGYYDFDINNTFSFPRLSPVVETLAKLRDGLITADEATGKINGFRNYDVRNDLESYSYHKSISQRHAVNVSGGSSNINYFFSAGFDKELSPLRDKAERFTSTLKSNISLSKRVGINVGFFYFQNRNEQGKFPSESHSNYPYERLFDDNGKSLKVTNRYRTDFVDQAVNRGFLDWSFNPVEDTKLIDNVTKNNEIRLTLGGNIKVIKGLSVDLNYQFQKMNNSFNNFQSEFLYATRDLINQFSQVDPITGVVTNKPIPDGAILDVSNRDYVSNNGRVQLNLNRTFGKNTINAVAGFEVREGSSSGGNYRLYGYDNETLTSGSVDYVQSYLSYPAGIPLNIPGSASAQVGNLDRFISSYINATYTYMERFIFSASARKDASNYFGVNANQRSVPLWSIGAKYDIDKESFYNVPWLPLLNFRVSYGFNGNINKDVSALTTINYQGVNLLNQLVANIKNPPNPDLKWETIGILNLGMDFALKNNVISGKFEYYTKRGDDLIGDGPLDGTTGIINVSGISSYRGNIANMKGSGVDITINSRNIDRTFKWSSNLIFSYNVDEVTRYNFKPTLATIFNENIISPVVGRPVNSIYSYKWGGLDPNTGDPQGYVNKEISKDYSSLTNTSIDNLVFNGRSRPSVFGALRNTFGYKGISLSANIIYKFGYYFRNKTINYSQLYVGNNRHSDYEKRWQNPGDELNTHVPSMIYPANSNRDTFYELSDILIEKADHIRFQDISLAYDFDRSKALHKVLKGLSVYFYLNNVGMIWKATKTDMDPDYLSLYPALKSFSFGIKAQL